MSEKRRERATAAQRGYGRRHKILRKSLEDAVSAGMAVCWRCRQPITPGEPWDLGHDDLDRSRYAGVEHAHCNRSAAARARNAPDPGPSRQWVAP